jgi:hypothetical protein
MITPRSFSICSIILISIHLLSVNGQNLNATNSTLFSIANTTILIVLQNSSNLTFNTTLRPNVSVNQSWVLNSTTNSNLSTISNLTTSATLNTTLNSGWNSTQQTQTIYILTYFPIRARAEFIRWILAAVNQSFQDVRIPASQWLAIKPTMPFGQLPVLEIRQENFSFVLAQSKAIGNRRI